MDRAIIQKRVFCKHVLTSTCCILVSNSCLIAWSLEPEDLGDLKDLWNVDFSAVIEALHIVSFAKILRSFQIIYSCNNIFTTLIQISHLFILALNFYHVQYLFNPIKTFLNQQKE